MAFQLVVFDTRRGNVEGQEEDKILGFYPTDVPLVQQTGLVGLLQGLLLFAATFTAPQRPTWECAETDAGLWVMLEAEPHLWLAALAARDWLPQHSSEASLRCLLAHTQLLIRAVCGGLQPLLEQDPSARLARGAVAAVLAHVGRQLCSLASWQQRELRNPLGDISMPPLLALPQGAALAVQSFVNQLLLGRVAGTRAVSEVLLLYGPHLLWSSLAPPDTAALCALLATGLVHASKSNGASKAGSKTGAAGTCADDGCGSRDAAGPAAWPSLRAIDGSNWLQLPNGFLTLKTLESQQEDGTADTSAAPLVHLTGAASGCHLQQQQAEGGAGRAEQQPWQPPPGQPGSHRLLPLLEGSLLVALLLPPDFGLTPHLLAGLHGLVAGPARQLAAQLREEVQPGKAEPGHLPGFRYLYQDSRQLCAQASPRVKVSAMSHHARNLAAAMRVPTPSQHQQQAQQAADVPQQQLDKGADDSQATPASEGGEGAEVLEVVAKSSQDCWVYAVAASDGRRLLAVRERRSEKDLPEAVAVLQEFAEVNFLM